MKAHVCHLTSVHPADDIRIFHKECLSLAAQGWQVTFVAPGNAALLPPGPVVWKLTKPFRGPTILRPLVSNLRSGWAACRTGADLFHFHDPELIPSGLLLKGLGKRVIYDAHEDLPRTLHTKLWIPDRLRARFGRLTELFENGAARCFDGVIGATETISERFGRVAGNVVTVRNFPRWAEFEAPPPPLISRRRRVAYVGKVTADRGAGHLLRLSADLDSEVVVAGAVYPTSLEEALTAATSSSHLVLKGVVGREEVVDTLYQSQVGLLLLKPLPSYLDSLPIKLFEYMAAGVPVVASNFPRWRGIIEAAGCGYCVDPDDYRAVHAAVTEILADPRAAQGMSEQGRAFVREHYCWETEAERLDSLYKRVLCD